jgi:hypothetical protein
MIPTKAALASAIEEARENVAVQFPQVHEIRVGGPADLDRTIGQLLADHIRFIIIHRMGQPPEHGWDWERDDSYGLLFSHLPPLFFLALTPHLFASSPAQQTTLYTILVRPAKLLLFS